MSPTCVLNACGPSASVSRAMGLIGDAKQVWKSSPVETRLTELAAMALMVNDRIQVEHGK